MPALKGLCVRMPIRERKEGIKREIKKEKRREPKKEKKKKKRQKTCEGLTRRERQGLYCLMSDDENQLH